MFTGIVEETGKVVLLETSGAGRLVLEAEKVLEGTQLGDSILVNGACLTVSSLPGGQIAMDLLGETLSKTNLGSLRRGDIVNLERSLTPQSRLGGHFVMGHVDGTGTITRFERSGEDLVLEIETEEDIAKRLTPKGSVSLDGISLTVVSVADRRFTVHIIPHTASWTNLRVRKPGNRMNIEIDVFARYLYDFLSRAGKLSGLTEETLRRAGFM